jgi:transcriptional regulator with XRE-family HTH domain
MHQSNLPQPGRPRGSNTFDPVTACAFGAVVKEMRLCLGFSQEDLASAARVERSHMGKIERGEHMPNLALILKLAKALEVRPGELVNRAAEQLEGYKTAGHDGE